MFSNCGDLWFFVTSCDSKVIHDDLWVWDIWADKQKDLKTSPLGKNKHFNSF